MGFIRTGHSTRFPEFLPFQNNPCTRTKLHTRNGDWLCRSWRGLCWVLLPDS